MATLSFTYADSLNDGLTANGVNFFAGTAAQMLYNDPPKALTSSYTVVSGGNALGGGNRAIIDNAYNGATFAFINADRTSTLFTFVSSASSQNVTVTNNNYDSTGPEERRKWQYFG